MKKKILFLMSFLTIHVSLLPVSVPKVNLFISNLEKKLPRFKSCLAQIKKDVETESWKNPFKKDKQIESTRVISILRKNFVAYKLTLTKDEEKEIRKLRLEQNISGRKSDGVAIDGEGQMLLAAILTVVCFPVGAILLINALT